MQRLRLIWLVLWRRRLTIFFTSNTHAGGTITEGEYGIKIESAKNCSIIGCRILSAKTETRARQLMKKKRESAKEAKWQRV